MNHGVVGKPELSVHRHDVKSVVVDGDPVRQHSIGDEAAGPIERLRAMVVAAHPQRQQLCPKTIRPVDQRFDDQTTETQSPRLRVDHDLGEPDNVPHRAWCSGSPSAHGLDLAVDPTQGKAGTASVRRHLPFTKPRGHVGGCWNLQPADRTSELNDGAHHAMDFTDGLVVGSIKPLDAGRLVRHACSIQHQRADASCSQATDLTTDGAGRPATCPVAPERRLSEATPRFR